MYPLLGGKVSQNVWLACEHCAKNVPVLKTNKRITVGCDVVIFCSICGGVPPFAYGCTASLHYNIMSSPRLGKNSVVNYYIKAMSYHPFAWLKFSGEYFLGL